MPSGSRADSETPRPFRAGPIWIGFCLAALVCAAMSIVVGTTIANLETSSEWVEHTHTVIERLGRLQDTLNEAANAVRNYMWSGEDTSVKRAIDAAERESARHLDELRHLTADNRAQQHNLDQLKPLIVKRVRFLKDAVALRQKSGPQAAEAFLIARLGKSYGIEIRDLINRMIALEDRLLTERGATQRNSAWLASNVAWVGWLLASAFLALAAIYVAHALRGLKIVTALAADREHQVQDARIALSDSTDLFQSVFASMAEGVIVSMQDSAEPRLYPAARQMLGIEESHGGFARWLATAEVVFAAGNKTSAGKNPFQAIESSASQDSFEFGLSGDTPGRWRWFVASLSPVRNEEGKVRGGVLVFRYITERKRHEETRAALASIVSATPDAVVSIAPDRAIRSWNHGAEAMYGYAEADALGERYESLVVPAMMQPEFKCGDAPGRRGRADGAV